MLTMLCLLSLGSAHGLFAQTGYLRGYVTDANNDSLAGVAVRLDFLGSSNGVHRVTTTTADARFAFDNLPTGFYSVNASLLGHGFAEAEVEIVPRVITYANLSLLGGIGWGEYTGVFTVRGVTIMHGNPTTGTPQYFLDVGSDSILDYRLCFGPPWYDMPAIHRPSYGQRVTISASLFGYSHPPMLIVRGIDNASWRDLSDNGGAGGMLQHSLGCPMSTYPRIELSGYVTVREISPPPRDSTVYIFQDREDSLHFYLDFGARNYEPDGPADRPATSRSIQMIGGFLNCEDSDLPRVIVYEFDELFWREPGDTVGFGWYDLDVTPIPPAVPVDYLTVNSYPNPFNSTTTIRFALPQAGSVRVEVFDMVGRSIDIIHEGFLAAGRYEARWEADDRPTGIYLCQVTSGSRRTVGRMILLR